MSITLDQCIKCDTGYFLDPTTKTCIENPNGIYGCVKYKSLNKC